MAIATMLVMMLDRPAALLLKTSSPLIFFESLQIIGDCLATEHRNAHAAMSHKGGEVSRYQRLVVECLVNDMVKTKFSGSGGS